MVSELKLSKKLGGGKLSSGQLMGVLFLLMGAYLFIFATWKREFILYKLSARRMIKLYGEKATHIYNKIFGIFLFVVGILILLEIL